ncbi:MAG: GNAT family N-acetyltransferase [Propionibacteriaceae bacterium]|jgi:RimJ/RimL family protein N-acetyltransferase|nr:GNAT family N-acetyltransferase [Propionibacteriaceae bacterium]
MASHDLTRLPLAGLTETAWLSPITADDVEAVFRICQDPDIQRWTTLPSPYRHSDAVGFAADLQPQAWADLAAGHWSGAISSVGLSWGIRRSGPGTGTGLCGVIGLKWIREEVWEIGWWLDPAARGRGLMTAAARAVLEAAFDPAGPLRASQVLWRAGVGNQASRAVAQRSGFHYLGLEPDRSADQVPLWRAALTAGQPIRPVVPWPIPQPSTRTSAQAEADPARQ